jgi:hypothetical protein
MAQQVTDLGTLASRVPDADADLKAAIAAARESMARELGVSEAEAARGAEALAPAILGGFKKHWQRGRHQMRRWRGTGTDGRAHFPQLVERTSREPGTSPD